MLSCDDQGYAVRLVRGAGVTRARWTDVEDAATTIPTPEIEVPEPTTPPTSVTSGGGNSSSGGGGRSGGNAGGGNTPAPAPPTQAPPTNPPQQKQAPATKPAITSLTTQSVLCLTRDGVKDGTVSWSTTNATDVAISEFIMR